MRKWSKEKGEGKGADRAMERKQERNKPQTERVGA